MIITIDGPAGSGKSTAARGLAEKLQFSHLDTGAMYRAVAWVCLERGIPLEDERLVADVARALDLRLDGPRVFIEAVERTDDLRTLEVSTASSRVAAMPEVRRELVLHQRRAAAGKDLITEGRDQGTVVFPDAECKFFLTADVDARARRRHGELERRGERISLETVRRQLVERDERDGSRSVAPLVAAADALVVDTTHLSESDVVAALEQHVLRARQKTTAAPAAPCRTTDHPH